MKEKINRNYDIDCWGILIISAICKFVYAYIVPYNVTPHDIGSVIDFSPHAYFHADYILYIAVFHKLPNFSPIGFGEFYHPPLFYVLSGVFIRVWYQITGNVMQAFEYLQFLNTGIACLSCVVIYLILKKIGLKEKTLFWGVVFFCFCPVFYHIGAAINNDCLMIFWSLSAIYFTICWIQKQSVKSIVGIALTLAFGILTKTSAILLSPAIGMVFLYAWIKNWDKWKIYLKQYIIFGCICIPLGMFWVVREKIRFDIPFNYVLKVEGYSQFVGDLDLKTRLGLPTSQQLLSCSIDWTNIKAYANVWGQTLFTMVFDEGCFQIFSTFYYWLSRILIWGTGVLAMGMIVALIRLLFDRKICVELRLLWIIGFVVLFSSYISFAFQYPQICTMNFRYIVVTLVLGISAILLEERSKYMTYIIRGMIMLVSASSAILFMFCAV